MAHSFGDVVLVPFPFTDQSGAKKRPAVIVSSSGYNAGRRDLVIMAITSQVRTPLGFGEALIADWQAAGLIKPSVAETRGHDHRAGACCPDHGRAFDRRFAQLARNYRPSYRLNQSHDLNRARSIHPMRKTKSKILEAVHDTTKGLYKAGVMDMMTLREFDCLCLPPVEPLEPEQIKHIREASRVSQAVFARLLNTSLSTVQKWEIGQKKPTGTALKLLHLVQKRGLEVVA